MFRGLDELTPHPSELEDRNFVAKAALRGLASRFGLIR